MPQLEQLHREQEEAEAEAEDPGVGGVSDRGCRPGGGGGSRGDVSPVRRVLQNAPSGVTRFTMPNGALLFPTSPAGGAMAPPGFGAWGGGEAACQTTYHSPLYEDTAAGIGIDNGSGSSFFVARGEQSGGGGGWDGCPPVEVHTSMRSISAAATSVTTAATVHLQQNKPHCDPAAVAVGSSFAEEWRARVLLGSGPGGNSGGPPDATSSAEVAPSVQRESESECFEGGTRSAITAAAAADPPAFRQGPSAAGPPFLSQKGLLDVLRGEAAWKSAADDVGAVAGLEAAFDAAASAGFGAATAGFGATDGFGAASADFAANSNLYGAVAVDKARAGLPPKHARGGPSAGCGRGESSSSRQRNALPHSASSQALQHSHSTARSAAPAAAAAATSALHHSASAGSFTTAAAAPNPAAARPGLSRTLTRITSAHRSGGSSSSLQHPGVDFLSAMTDKHLEEGVEDGSESDDEDDSSEDSEDGSSSLSSADLGIAAAGVAASEDATGSFQVAGARVAPDGGGGGGGGGGGVDLSKRRVSALSKRAATTTVMTGDSGGDGASGDDAEGRRRRRQHQERRRRSTSQHHHHHHHADTSKSKQAERWKDGMRSVVQHSTMVTEVLDSKTQVWTFRWGGGIWACLHTPA